MQAYAIVPDPKLSIARGPPLEEEPGLGALTLPGLLEEVTVRFGMREAIAQPRPDGSVERWSYEQLSARAMAIARALVATGVVGKGTRVGMLMTNRAEFVATAFGIAMAGGVVTVFSTFSTAHELDMMLAASGCAALLIEPKVLKKDFAEILRALEPAIGLGRPGAIASRRYPFLRHVAALDADETMGAIESWAGFLARGEAVSETLVQARAALVAPADPGVLLFSSGTTGKPKGILSAHRGVCIQMWRWPRILGMREGDRVLTANGFFWSG
ncbi:MAG: AMP-binding protein, partial [Novosphingobium sp.]|nr:AMP-binding protein [Novosphingobium sp.]